MGLRLEIYGRDDCRFCAAAQAFCQKRGLPFDYLDLSEHPTLWGELAVRAPQATTVPQIFIGDHRIGGFEDLQRNYGVVQQILGG